KKKQKVERTRYRENARGFRQTSAPAATAEPDSTKADQSAAGSKAKGKKGTDKAADQEAQKPGKKEKIRFGQAPRATLPTATKASETVDAGALPADTAAADEPANPLEPRASETKTRYSARAKTIKQEKAKATAAAAANKANAPAPDSGEVADRATQSTPLGLNGDTSTKKKKKAPATTTG